MLVICCGVVRQFLEERHVGSDILWQSFQTRSFVLVAPGERRRKLSKIGMHRGSKKGHQRLRGGRVDAVAVTSPHILNAKGATYAQSADWGVEEAEGFIKLFGMSSTLYASVNR